MRLEGFKCLVSGGAGFIGSHLVERLIAGHNHVIIIDNLSNGKLENISNLVNHPLHRLSGKIFDHSQISEFFLILIMSFISQLADIVPSIQEP